MELQGGNGDISWCRVNGIIVCVQKMERAKEGVAILLKDVWHSLVLAPIKEMVKKGTGSGTIWA